jgi:hypothetical protein
MYCLRYKIYEVLPICGSGELRYICVFSMLLLCDVTLKLNCKLESGSCRLIQARNLCDLIAVKCFGLITISCKILTKRGVAKHLCNQSSKITIAAIYEMQVKIIGTGTVLYKKL